jgi:hypothetical protein
MSRRSISGATRPSNPARASAPRRPAGALIAGALVALGVMALAPDAQAWSESKKGERMREVESAWPHAYWGPDISATAIFGCVAEVFGVPTGCSAGLKQTVTEVGQQASVDLLGLLRDAANHQVDLATLDAKIGYIEFEHRECTDNPLSHGPFGIGPRTVCTPWGLDPNVKAYFVWRIKEVPGGGLGETGGVQGATAPVRGDGDVSSLARWMADVNGDGRADFCRFVGKAPDVFLSCALATPTGFDDQHPLDSVKRIDQGYASLPRLMADVNGDGRADFCRFVGNDPDIFLSCALATPTGFDDQHPFDSVKRIDQGYAWLPRVLADVNGDGRADFCRFVGNDPDIFLSCALATPTGFDDEHPFNSARRIDQGYRSLPQVLADVNGDGRADFCRFVGNAPDVFLSCALATPTGFDDKHPLDSVKRIDQGSASLPRVLADVNGDGRADFCRFVGKAPDVFLSCALATPTGFDDQHPFDSVKRIDWGYGPPR